MGYADYGEKSSKNIIICAIVVIIIVSVPIFFFLLDPYETITTTTDTTTDTTTTTPPVTENPHEVAIVFATEGLGDKSFNDMTYEGASRAHDDYNVNFTYAQPTVIPEYEGFLRQYAAHSGYPDPYDLIISIGYDQAAALEVVAEDYPDQKFAIVDMQVNSTTYPNVASLLFRECEGAALVGAMAGLMTQTDKIGFIGGMDIPLINKFAAGYVFGANYSNPDCNVTLTYTWDFGDPAIGKSYADTLFDIECDIIYHVAGRTGLGIFDSAKENNETSSTPLWVIGNDVPQMYLGCADPDNPEPPTVGLTSMLKRVDVAVYDIILDAIFGSWTGGEKMFDLSNGGVDYEINTDLLTLPSSVITAVEDLKALIIAGTVVVPDAIYWT